MRRYIIYILLFPLALFAQNDGKGMLDKAVEKLIADYPLQMTFVVSVHDESGALRFVDEGCMKIDKKDDSLVADRYQLLMNNMKVWCDGATLWSYMEPTDETYILAPDDESARIFSPVHLMQLYKLGYSCTLKKEGESNVVTLLSQSADNDFGKIDVVLNSATLRPEKIVIYIEGEGTTELKIATYWPRCNFEKRIFTYPKEDYPDAEIVDMR